MSLPELLLVGLASIAAGVVNAVAGGGTLIAFPALLALGVPPIAANVTSKLALLPGYFGGTFAQRADLLGQRSRLIWILPTTFVAGLAGALLLIRTEERLFNALVPYLILLSAVLIAVQEPVRAWVIRFRGLRGAGPSREAAAALPILLAAVYGGYFGAGLGVIILALLGLLLHDSLVRLNALKQAMSLSTTISASLFFAFSGQVLWQAALIMGAGALLGGAWGGRLARRVKPQVLRWSVVTIGVAIAFAYFVK